MVNKARGVLAFIKRWSKEFDDPYVTKTLFILLVRPIDYRLQQSTRACDAFASPCSWMCLKGAAIYGGV